MTRIAVAPPEPSQVRPGAVAARFSAAEFVQVASAADSLGIELELIDGELHRMTPPMGTHVEVHTSIIVALAKAVEGTELKAGVEVGVQLDPSSIVACDVALLRTQRFERRFFRPDELALVIEVADTSLRRDEGPKREAYALAGIAEYWVVDIVRAVVHRHRDPIEGVFAQVDTIRFGEPLAIPGTDATIALT